MSMRSKLFCTLLLIAALAALLVFPTLGEKFYIQLVTKVMIMAIFAMSLDLLVGYTGLVSLGHAAFFGLAATSWPRRHRSTRRPTCGPPCRWPWGPAQPLPWPPASWYCAPAACTSSW